MKTQFIKIFAIVMMVAGVESIAFGADQTRPVSGFTSIASAGSFNVHVKIDGNESLKISAPDDIINEIETVVENGNLKLQYKNNHFWNKNDHGNPKIDIYISAKALSTLINSGSGSIKVENTINTSKFKAVLSGSGSITTGVKAETLSVVISGSGNINLNGKTTDANLIITGSGTMDGKALQTESSTVVISGSGHTYICAGKELNTKIIGSGSVQYSGDATLNTTKIGSGRVSKIN